MKKQILIFGGLGNPEHSVIKLYLELFVELQSQFSLVAIDPTTEPDIARQRLFQATGINYQASYSSFSHYKEHHKAQSISAIFVLTPVIHHLTILKQLQTSLDHTDCLVVIEKPSFALNEIEEGFSQVAKAMKAQGNRFYFIDTAMVAPSLVDFSNNQYVPKNTLPNKIIAIGVDNPFNPHPRIADFGFNNKVSAFNDRRLLDLSSSGGAGFGLDMGIHAIAGLMSLIEKLPISDVEYIVDKVVLEALSHPQLLRDKEAETYMLCSGHIHSAEKDIPFIVEGGKGGNTWDRRLELYYDSCVIALGFGTLKYQPYMCLISESSIARHNYDVDHSGYVQHFIDIRNLLALSDQEAIISSEASEKIMQNSMMLINQIYRHSINPATRAREISMVTKHENHLLNIKEKTVRIQLHEMLEATL